MFSLPGQWNVAPLPVAEESHLLEAEITIASFETDTVEEVDGESENIRKEFISVDQGLSKSGEFSESELNVEDESEVAESSVERNDTVEPVATSSPSQVSSPFLYLFFYFFYFHSD